MKAEGMGAGRTSGEARALKGLAACSTLIVLTCLLLLLPPLLLARKGEQIEAAVRASYPQLCADWRDEVVARPSPVGWFLTWEVRCRLGYLPEEVSLMTVNVLTCRVAPPLSLSSEWQHVYAALVGAGTRLTVCP